MKKAKLLPKLQTQLDNLNVKLAARSQPISCPHNLCASCQALAAKQQAEIAMLNDDINAQIQLMTDVTNDNDT